VAFTTVATQLAKEKRIGRGALVCTLRNGTLFCALTTKGSSGIVGRQKLERRRRSGTSQNWVGCTERLRVSAEGKDEGGWLLDIDVLRPCMGEAGDWGPRCIETVLPWLTDDRGRSLVVPRRTIGALRRMGGRVGVGDGERRGSSVFSTFAAESGWGAPTTEEISPATSF